MNVNATSSATVPLNSGPAPVRVVRGAWVVTTYRRPALVMRSVTLVAFRSEGSTRGACRVSSAGRAGLAGTPLATGYSNEVPFSRTS